MTQLDIFYNTTELEGTELKEAKIRAGTQNDRVLKVFRDNPDKAFSPTEVHQLTNRWNTPLTSIRRAITTLTALGYLERTDEKRPGWYGMNNYCWKLRNS